MSTTKRSIKYCKTSKYQVAIFHTVVEFWRCYWSALLDIFQGSGLQDATPFVFHLSAIIIWIVKGPFLSLWIEYTLRACLYWYFSFFGHFSPFPSPPFFSSGFQLFCFLQILSSFSFTPILFESSPSSFFPSSSGPQCYDHHIVI